MTDRKMHSLSELDPALLPGPEPGKPCNCFGWPTKEIQECSPPHGRKVQTRWMCSRCSHTWPVFRPVSLA